MEPLTKEKAMTNSELYSFAAKLVKQLSTNGGLIKWTIRGQHSSMVWDLIVDFSTSEICLDAYDTSFTGIAFVSDGPYDKLILKSISHDPEKNGLIKLRLMYNLKEIPARTKV